MPQLHITYIARGFVNPNGNNNDDEIGEEIFERSNINFEHPSELHRRLIDDYEHKIVPLYREILIPEYQDSLERVEFNFDNVDDAYADIFIENWRLRNQIDFRPRIHWNINNFPTNRNNTRTVTPPNSPISIRSTRPSSAISVRSNTGFKGGKRCRRTKKRSTRRKRHTRR